MTSQVTRPQKPALPPKPVKYRAPLPPTTSPPTSSVSRASPVVKKYRAPAPPTGRPPPPPPPPSAASAASASAVTGRTMMRREPMQVLPSSVATYERCRTATTTNDGVVVNGPRPGKVTDETSSHRREALNQSASTTPEAPDGVVADKSSTGDGQKEGSRSVNVAVKPVIRDVKLCPRNSVVLSASRQQRTVRTWRSTESIDRLITGATPVDGGGGASSARSSFADRPASVGGTTTAGAACGRRSVYIDLGEYQTLLKHGRQDAVYSLPQPHCYGDDTLRAVKLITDKYDTFKRRQMRAISFRDTAAPAAAAAAAVKTSRPQSSAENDTIAEDQGQAMNAATDDSDHRHAETLMTTTSDVALAPSTLSRTVLSLSRCDLDSASSVHDVANPLEVDVVDDSECGVSRTDRLRIEMFYRSHETEVYVCSCLADLFVGALGRRGVAGRWVHVHTGVPVWLLNTGRGRRPRRLTLAVAERRTALPLWHDRITYLSNYAQADDGDVGDDTSHLLRPSSNLSSAVRISMFNRRSAAAFLDRFHRFTADPVDDLWKISDDRDGAAETGGGWPWRLRQRRRQYICGDRAAASKDSISQPCHVVLVSRTDVRHPNFRSAFAHLLPPPASSSPPAATSPPPDCRAAPTLQPAPAEAEGNEFRPRLPTR